MAFGDDFCNKAFSIAFMLLKPEDFNIFDWLKVLCSKKLHERNFIDSSHSNEFSFWQRVLVMISIIVIKLLQLFAAPLALFGCFLEHCLNFLSANGGLWGFLNIILWKLKLPNSSSAEYKTLIAYTDGRTMLDKSIKPGDGSYTGALCMMASKLAYENEARVTQTVEEVWKMEFLGFFNFWNEYLGKRSTQAFMMRDKSADYDTIVLTFRGTETFSAHDWISNIDLSWYEFEGFGKVHGGFMKALGLQKSVGWPKELNKNNESQPLAYYTLRKKLKKLLKENEETRFVVTGHGLGGALAILFPFILAFHDEKLLLERLEGVYTYGQPRVGDAKLGAFMMKTFSQYKIGYHRFVYGSDIVPLLPLDDGALNFKHFGLCIYFDLFYNARILEEEPWKNYFSIMGALMRRIRACLELGRSCIIVCTRGKEYEEGVLMKIIRLIALFVPGFTSHCPRDYVNSSRLGTKAFLASPF